MKELHEKYLELKGKEPEDDVPVVMTLDERLNKKEMKKFIQKHFSSSIFEDRDSIDGFFDFYRNNRGELNCQVLVGYKSKGEAFYFEADDIDEDEVQKVLRDVPIGGELHVHVKGKDGNELEEQLANYLLAQKSEPIQWRYGVGRVYKDGGYLCINWRVLNESGWHMRPVTEFTKKAKEYDETEILVSNGRIEENGKSPMSLLMLGVPKGKGVTIKTKGKYAEKALNELYDLCTIKFGEDK